VVINKQTDRQAAAQSTRERSTRKQADAPRLYKFQTPDRYLYFKTLQTAPKLEVSGHTAPQQTEKRKCLFTNSDKRCVWMMTTNKQTNKQTSSGKNSQCPLTYPLLLIKPRRMRWTGHVACTGEMRHSYKILVGNMKERDHLDDLRSRWKSY